MSKHKDAKGAIYHRADGRREAQFILAGATRKRVYGRTRREVLRKLREVRWSVSYGVPVSSRKPHLGAYLGYWLDMTRAGCGRARSGNCELGDGRVKPHLGRVPRENLRPAAIQE